MNFKIKLSPSGHSFECRADQELLKSGLSSGYLIPFSCRSGMCLSCKGRVLSGQVDHGDAHIKYLSQVERDEGFALLCCARPLSDLHIQIEEIDPDHGNAPKKLPARILEMHDAAPGVKILILGLPANEPMHFRAGQFLDIILKDGQRRSYSIANVPKAEGVRQLEIHLRHMPGGIFTDHVFTNMKAREIVHIEMPLGNFYLREDSEKPIILLASGTGFAPIKSILNYTLERHIKRPIHLYWGARRPLDLYDIQTAQHLANEHLNIDFIPVVSDPLQEDAWSGRLGLVHQAVMMDHPNLLGFEVYACGTPLMVEAARADFIEKCHLKVTDFHADSFLSMADIDRLTHDHPPTKS